MKKEVYGVVYYLKSPSGLYYIGQTVNFKRRMRAYKAGGSKNQSKLFRAIAKYGFENFEVKILCNCFDKQDLDDREIHCIKIFNSIENGYNCASGGSNGKHSEESKRKMSESCKKSFTDERRMCISQRQKGKKASQETRDLMSFQRRGKKIPSSQGRKLSKEAVKKIISHLIGRKVSDETKRKMSETAKANWKKRKALYV